MDLPSCCAYICRPCRTARTAHHLSLGGGKAIRFWASALCHVRVQCATFLSFICWRKVAQRSRLGWKGDSMHLFSLAFEEIRMLGGARTSRTFAVRTRRDCVYLESALCQATVMLSLSTLGTSEFHTFTIHRTGGDGPQALRGYTTPFWIPFFPKKLRSYAAHRSPRTCRERSSCFFCLHTRLVIVEAFVAVFHHECLQRRQKMSELSLPILMPHLATAADWENCISHFQIYH